MANPNENDRDRTQGGGQQGGGQQGGQPGAGQQGGKGDRPGQQRQDQQRQDQQRQDTGQKKQQGGMADTGHQVDEDKDDKGDNAQTNPTRDR